MCAPSFQGVPDIEIPETKVKSASNNAGNTSVAELAREMIQQTIHNLISTEPEPEILILPDGPYAVIVQGD
jgi:hypothetical protein